MASNINEETQCPICTDTFIKPIRMLSCGHNFCHECLSQLYAAFQDLRCPSCRARVILDSKGLEGISRNHALENIIEGLEKVRGCANREHHSDEGKPTLGKNAVKQLKELAKSYRQKNNYQSTVETLQLVLDQVDGWKKLKPTLSLIECLIELGQLEEAILVCDNIASIVDSSQINISVKHAKNVYDERLEELILKLIKSQKYNCSASLIKCRYDLVKKLFEKESRFNKLANVAWLASKITKKASKQQKHEPIKAILSFFQDIVDYMQKTKDVGLKFKCEQVACVLMHFGYCCNKADEKSKAIILNNQAIAIMETAFGEESKLHHMIGLCQNNLGNAYLNTHQLQEAKAAYVKAIEVYSKATDWPSEKKKKSCSTSTVHNLEKVALQLS